jgi:hypothetical protein
MEFLDWLSTYKISNNHLPYSFLGLGLLCELTVILLQQCKTFSGQTVIPTALNTKSIHMV